MRIPGGALACLGVLIAGCGDLPAPAPAVANVTSVRLTLTAPTSATRLNVGLAPACAVVAGGIQLPLDADVTLAASFYNEAAELDPVANNAAEYRLSGGGSADPAPSVGTISFNRVTAFTGQLRASTATSASITLSLVHVPSGRVDWGPCTLPITAVAPEPATAGEWSAPAGSPVSLSAHFQDGSFLSPSEGFVVGIAGEVHYTNDGGTTWEQRFTSPPNQPFGSFRSVAFVSPTKGWIGDLGPFATPQPGRSLWETNDGGRTWTNISSRVTGATVIGMCGMWAISPTTIVGVGRWAGPAVFLKTTDAGATWQSLSLAPMLTGAVDVYFFDATRGIIAGGRGVGLTISEQQSSVVVVLGTSDGGATWTERFVGTVPGAWSWKISFPTPNVGYVATQGPSSGGIVLKTFDGGATWRETSIIGTSTGSFWGAGFVSDRVGWVGEDNAVWETRDGGLTWSKQDWAGQGTINRFRMFANGTALAMGKQVYRYAP